MNKLSTEQRALLVSCLVEGNSIRSTARMTAAAAGRILDGECTISVVVDEEQS